MLVNRRDADWWGASWKETWPICWFWFSSLKILVVVPPFLLPLVEGRTPFFATSKASPQNLPPWRLRAQPRAILTFPTAQLFSLQHWGVRGGARQTMKRWHEVFYESICRQKCRAQTQRKEVKRKEVRRAGEVFSGKMAWVPFSAPVLAINCL